MLGNHIQPANYASEKLTPPPVSQPATTPADVVEPPGQAAKLLCDWGYSAKEHRSKMLESQILDNSKGTTEEIKKDSEWEFIDDDDFGDEEELVSVEKAKKLPLKSAKAEAINIANKKKTHTASKDGAPQGFNPQPRERTKQQASKPVSSIKEVARETAPSEEDSEDGFELVMIPSPATQDSEWLPLSYIPPRRSSYHHTATCQGQAGIKQCPLPVSEAETLAALTKGMPEIAFTHSQVLEVIKERGGSFHEHEKKIVHIEGVEQKVWKYAPVECDASCPKKSMIEKSWKGLKKVVLSVGDYKDALRAKF